MAIFDSYDSIDKSRFNVVHIVRSIFLENATLGRLFINDVHFGYTLEPYYIDFSNDSYKKDIINSEIAAEKAIQKRFHNRFVAVPNGVYNLRLNILSPKYYNKQFYRKLNGGYMPRVIDIPSYEGVLIHPGNYVKDTQACCLVGYSFDKNVPAVYNSQDCFINIYNKLKSFKYPIKICYSCV